MIDQTLMDSLASYYNDRDAKRTRASIQAAVEQIIVKSPTGFWHPLGFFRIEFGKDRAGLRYAFHFWPTEYRSTQIPAWMIHRHIWDLESFIVLGGLRDYEYSKVESGDADTSGAKYLAHVRVGGSTLEKTEEALFLSTRSIGEYGHGDFYRVDIGQFHQTAVPTDVNACTLVRIGPRLRQESVVLGDTNGPASIHYDRVPVEPTMIETGLHALLM